MQSTYVLGCILILIEAGAAGAQRLTTSDPNFSALSQLADSIGWYQLSATKAWSVGDNAVDLKKGASCMATLDKLRAARVPDSRTVEVRWEAPEFKPGVHSLAEIRASCAHVERVGRIHAFEKWALLSMQAGPNAKSASDFYRLCVQTYNEIVKAGVPPTDRVPDNVIGGAAWSGSIEELRRKYCDAGMSKAHEQAAASEAPYRKEMKSDKLRIALKYGSVFVPGGVGTSDARKMADASVWFIDLSPPRRCNDGRQVHTLRRYQFSVEQQLVKTTEHDYCGSAPRAAFQ